MKLNRIALTLATLMCTASVAGLALRSNPASAQRGAGVALGPMVPTSFGDWNELPNQAVMVVNPQTQQIIDRLYSQTLVRTYVNRDGYRIMLSLAYGDDQRGGLAAHRPEVCYPAQGFKLGRVADGVLPTRYGNIEVRRLTTHQGPRNEPVTYWLTVGDQIVKSSWDRRIAEVRVGLTGQVPDGLLFRVSSIDTDAQRAFAMQQQFAAAMMAAVPTDTRRRLSGLTSKDESAG